MDSKLRRVLREAGAPGVLDALAGRLSPTDLQTLLLEVARRRAARVTPSRLLAQYETNRFTAPSRLDPLLLARLDVLILERIEEHGFEGVELSPVCPLGTNSAVATVDQNKVLTTVRTTEVVADATNVLALECAVRRRRLLRSGGRHERVRLGATHRVTRAQVFTGEGMVPHFKLMALCTAGRDEGAFRFEADALAGHIRVHLDVLERAGHPATAVRVTDLTGGRHRQVLKDVHPRVVFDDDRTSGYYTQACFEIFVGEHAVVDGGFTTWTAGLLGNAKERLLVSGLGVEHVSRLTPPVDGADPKRI